VDQAGFTKGCTNLPSASNSENRLRVTFQIIKAMAPKTAMPPATDNPTMVPVPTGVLSLPVSEGEGAVLDEEDVVVLVSLLVTSVVEVDVEPVVDDVLELVVLLLVETGKLGPVMVGRP
jgi:hypothetical protein